MSLFGTEREMSPSKSEGIMEPSGLSIASRRAVSRLASGKMTSLGPQEQRLTISDKRRVRSKCFLDIYVLPILLIEDEIGVLYHSFGEVMK